MSGTPIEEYVWNEFENPPRSVPYKLAYNLKSVRETVSEIFWKLLGKDYCYIASCHGFALALDSPDQLEEVVARFKRKLRYLGVSGRMQGGRRPGECLDFSILTPLQKLRGLSAGYMLDSRNASAIERLTSLCYLALAWDLDESVDLTELPQLRDLNIMASPHLASVWQLRSLRRLRINRHRYPDLTPASDLGALKQLEISESSKLLSLDGIGKLCNLRFLGLYYSRNIKKLTPLEETESLEYLVIESCSKLENIDAVGNLPNLKYLEVRACRRLNSVTPFPAMPNLTHVFFIDCGKLDRPIEEIVAALPNLKYFWKIG